MGMISDTDHANRTKGVGAAAGGMGATKGEVIRAAAAPTGTTSRRTGAYPIKAAVGVGTVMAMMAAIRGITGARTVMTSRPGAVFQTAIAGELR